MCGLPRIRRRTAPDGFAGRFIQDIAATAGAAAGQHWPAPATIRPRRSTTTRPRLRPHTIQLPIHCPLNPAGFWAYRTGGRPARQPWCLSRTQVLVPGRNHLIPADGRGGAGRFR